MLYCVNIKPNFGTEMTIALIYVVVIVGHRTVTCCVSCTAVAVLLVAVLHTVVV